METLGIFSPGCLSRYSILLLLLLLLFVISAFFHCVSDEEPAFGNSSTGSSQNVYLFNIAQDPEERHDLSQSMPDMVQKLHIRLAKWNSTAVHVNYPPVDKRCNPALRGGVWGPWM